MLMVGGAHPTCTGYHQAVRGVPLQWQRDVDPGAGAEAEAIKQVGPAVSLTLQRPPVFGSVKGPIFAAATKSTGWV
ncbi:MAG: hypothetical protein BMS9Abin36_1669 [Gammaproteobacteria bacterium]|nr:MAG: hypothetical protein BMS9Abin36_1669 [Gammaproteobacteria bacterium]